MARRNRQHVPLAMGAAGALAGICVCWRFRRDLRKARERAAAGGRIVQTACGPIEYGEAGEGAPILGIHGAGGGYDQTLLLGRLLLDPGCRVIAPSRFGYLRTPIPEDNSVEAQADAHACLLDALGVERVTVVAISAGGPSGLHFALRHPQRTAALVLVSAISYGGTPEAEVRWRRTRHRLARESDGVYWLGLAVMRALLLLRRNLSSTERAIARQILQAGLPLRERMPGTRLDQGRRLSPDVPLEQICAPTLVIHARDDPVVLYAHAQQATSRIPGAELMAFERGGHSLLGHHDETRARIVAWLAEVAG